MSQTIHIDRVEDATTNGGNNPGSPYKIVHSGNDKYFVFNGTLFPLLAAGATIEIEGEVGKNGAKRISKVVRTLPTPNGSAAVTGGQAAPNQREAVIMRECALKCAVELAKAPIGATWQLTEIVTAASALLAWLSDEQGEPF